MTPTQRRLHFARVAQLPCFATGKFPVQLHHPIGGSMVERVGVRGTKKHSDYLVLPLHHDAHQGADGVHTIGVLEWEAKFGAQAQMIDDLGKLLRLDLWGLARQDAEQSRANRKRKPLRKIIPHSGAL